MSKRIEKTVFETAAVQTGRLSIASGASLDEVTLNIGDTFGRNFRSASVQKGLTLKNTLEIGASPNDWSCLYLVGEYLPDSSRTI